MPTEPPKSHHALSPCGRGWHEVPGEGSPHPSPRLHPSNQTERIPRSYRARHRQVPTTEHPPSLLPPPPTHRPPTPHRAAEIPRPLLPRRRHTEPNILPIPSQNPALNRVRTSASHRPIIHAHRLRRLVEPHKRVDHHLPAERHLHLIPGHRPPSRPHHPRRHRPPIADHLHGRPFALKPPDHRRIHERETLRVAPIALRNASRSPRHRLRPGP